MIKTSNNTIPPLYIIRLYLLIHSASMPSLPHLYSFPLTLISLSLFLLLRPLSYWLSSLPCPWTSGSLFTVAFMHECCMAPKAGGARHPPVGSSSGVSSGGTAVVGRELLQAAAAVAVASADQRSATTHRHRRQCQQQPAVVSNRTQALPAVLAAANLKGCMCSCVYPLCIASACMLSTTSCSPLTS